MGEVAHIGASVPAAYPDGIPRDVCLYFEKLALDLIRDGHKRYSADGILHRIRWHWQVERGDRGFLCQQQLDGAARALVHRPQSGGEKLLCVAYRETGASARLFKLRGK
jgi:hypothetical protein